MLYPLIGIGLLFIGIGYLINEKNAQYLLSGYNTMPREQQRKVLIRPYLRYFKKFHLFLGLSYIGIGILLNYINTNALGLFLGIYPILAYLYFTWNSKQYFKDVERSKNKTKIAVIVLALSLVFVGLVFYQGYKEDEIYLKNDKIIIEGFYGEEIALDQIKSIELTDNLPKIKKRTNGFSAGNFHKGHYETEDGKRIKLVINGESEQYLLLTKNSGSRIYYSPRSISPQEIYNKLRSISSK
ncbi:DUF3784 domain-containing protein [Pseudozobellia sp. WGM2]|uniref:DUF3784 domain-containing protein n=1 Tax=Pseudozobellia sp. WGM2 TaxID=2787625 RepID=UPI001ADF2517|nr:DUF3784 domain-containing protein [Pseudozobellia sp. WGM2]